MQALELFRDLDDRAGEAYALTELGLVHQLTGNLPTAAASQRQALVLFRDAAERIGEAEALNNLGELLTAPATTRRARDCHDRRWPSHANSARRCKKHEPWRVSAAAISRTATPAKAPPACSRR